MGIKSSVVKAANTTKDLIKSTSRLLNSLLDKPMKQAGGALGDSVSFWRWTNRLRIAHRAEKIIQEDGLAKKILPPSFLMPLIEMAGDVEDPALQELWARLIASGAQDKKHQHPAFAKTLSQLSCSEALLLELISECVFEFTDEFDFNVVTRSYQKRPLSATSSPLAKIGCDEDELWTFLSHLHHLGLMIPEATEEITYFDSEQKSPLVKRVFITAAVTTFGAAFLNACKPSAKFGRLWKKQESWKLLADSSNNSNNALKVARSAKQVAENAETTAEDLQGDLDSVRFDLEDLESKLPKPPDDKKKKKGR